MAITIDWGTKVIYVPKSFMTQVQTDPFEVRELNLNTFRLALKDLEDSENGQVFPDTHRHNTEVSLAGITLARVVEIINGYTVTFEDGQYAINLVGANSNVADVTNLNQVSIRAQNSAGLIVSDNVDINAIMTLMGITIWDNEDAETGLSMRNVMRLIAAAEAGKVSGVTGGTADEWVSVFNALLGNKARIRSLVDQYGNRKQIILDLT